MPDLRAEPRDVAELLEVGDVGAAEVVGEVDPVGLARPVGEGVQLVMAGDVAGEGPEPSWLTAWPVVVVDSVIFRGCSGVSAVCGLMSKT